MFASSNIKYKTSMCKHYQQNGTCNLGLKCHFAHGPEELRTLNDPLPQHVPMNHQQQQQRSEPRKPTPNITQNALPPTIANYKTVKCRFFEKGFCKFAQNCGFAHGDTEIRNQNSPLPQNIANISQNVGSGPNALGSNLQNQIIQEQISYLIAQMQAYHGSDPEFQAKIKQAQEINDLGNHQGAASLVYVISSRNLILNPYRKSSTELIKVKKTMTITVHSSKIYKLFKLLLILSTTSNNNNKINIIPLNMLNKTLMA